MGLSKGASDVLIQDIRQIETELAALETSMRQIENRREALHYKLNLLKNAIGIDPQGSTPPLPFPPHHSGNGIESHTEATGFRASIRAVLRDAAKGMRPRDVFNEMVKRGVSYSGKSDPIIRTSTEMWRMQKIGQLRKRGQLYYPQDTGQGG